MLDDLANASNFSGAGGSVRVDDAEAQVSVKESMHHNAVTELEDLERKDSSRE